MKTILYRMQVSAICLIAWLSGLLIGKWWAWPACWLFLFCSGIGARLGTVRLPRKVERDVWNLYDESCPIAQKWLERSNDKEKTIYYTVGEMSVLTSNHGLHYSDAYDWHPGTQVDLPITGLAARVLGRITPLNCWYNEGHQLESEDEDWIGLGKPFVTAGLIVSPGFRYNSYWGGDD